MKVERTASNDVHTSSVMTQIAQLHGPCMGCTECTGICAALLDALTVPDLVLTQRRAEA